MDEFVVVALPAAPKPDPAGASPEAEARAVGINPPGEAESATPAADPMPLPTEARTIFLGGLFALAALAALFVAQAIILPVILAFILSLMLQPPFRRLVRWHFPRAAAAFLVVAFLGAIILGLGAALSVPAASLGKTISEGFPKLEQRLRPLQKPIGRLQEILTKAQQATGGTAQGQATVTVERIGVVDVLFSGTRAALEALVTTGVLLFFLMMYGEVFLRRIVEIAPTFDDKRRTVEISHQIEQDISAYLFTVTGMNAVVGIAAGAAMWFCGIGDPVLWGAMAFLLNFVPILGPLVGVGVFLLAGMLHFDDLGPALMPGATYLAIHLVEGELVTPMLLAKRFTLNPVAVILALIFWYWMWGVAGAVLATPMLAITKIVCDRIRPFRAFGHFLQGEATAPLAYAVKKRSRTRS